MDVFQLAANHVWKAAPGCRILVVDNGGLRCDIPREWIVHSPRRHVFVIDRFPPDNRCLMAISCRRVSFEVMALPLVRVLEEWTLGEDREVLHRGPVIRFRRWPMEAAWMELRVAGPNGGDIFTRICAARADCTLTFLVLDYHADAEASAGSAWETVMETLRVGEYIAEARTGRRRMQRG